MTVCEERRRSGRAWTHVNSGSVMRAVRPSVKLPRKEALSMGLTRHASLGRVNSRPSLATRVAYLTGAMVASQRGALDDESRCGGG